MFIIITQFQRLVETDLIKAKKNKKSLKIFFSVIKLTGKRTVVLKSKYKVFLIIKLPHSDQSRFQLENGEI